MRKNKTIHIKNHNWGNGKYGYGNPWIETCEYSNFPQVETWGYSNSTPSELDRIMAVAELRPHIPPFFCIYTLYCKVLLNTTTVVGVVSGHSKHLLKYEQKKQNHSSDYPKHLLPHDQAWDETVFRALTLEHCKKNSF